MSEIVDKWKALQKGPKVPSPPKTPGYDVRGIQSSAPSPPRELAPQEIAGAYPELVAKRPELLDRLSKRGLAYNAQAIQSTRNVAPRPTKATMPFKSPLVPLAGITAGAGFWDVITKNTAEASRLGYIPFYNAQQLTEIAHSGWGQSAGGALTSTPTLENLTVTYLTPFQAWRQKLAAMVTDRARGHGITGAYNFIKGDPEKFNPWYTAPAASIRSVAEQALTGLGKAASSLAPFSLIPINYMMENIPGPYQTGQTKITS